MRRLKTANPEEAKVILQTADPHTVYFHTHNFTHSKLPHYATGHTKVLAGAATPSVGLKTVKDLWMAKTGKRQRVEEESEVDGGGGDINLRVEEGKDEEGNTKSGEVGEGKDPKNLTDGGEKNQESLKVNEHQHGGVGDAMDVDGEHNSLERRGRLEGVDKEREKPVDVSSEEKSGSEDGGGLERPVVEIEESEENSGSEGENDFEEEGGLEGNNRAEAERDPHHGDGLHDHGDHLYGQDHPLGEAGITLSEETIVKLGERVAKCLKLCEEEESEKLGETWIEGDDFLICRPCSKLKTNVLCDTVQI